MARKPAEPAKPPPPPTEPPEHLSEGSKALWRAVVKQAIPAGRAAILTTALEARDRAEAARLAIEREGMVSTTRSTGALHVNPLLKVERDNRALFASIWGQLGLGHDSMRGWQ